MRISILQITSDKWTKTHEQLLQFVSTARSKKIKKYVTDLNKLQSLYAALLTRMKISELTCLPPHHLRFSNNDFNKPLLLNRPKMYFNFSHSNQKVLLCLSNFQNVGCDIELIKNDYIKDYVKVANDIFNSKEIEYIKRGKQTNYGERFFKIWTQKEAYLKRIGTGFIKNTVSINTLSFPSSCIYSWKEGDYYCAVNYQKPENIEKNYVTEKDIYQFYL